MNPLRHIIVSIVHGRSFIARYALLMLVAVSAWSDSVTAMPSSSPDNRIVVPNDNQRPAGLLADGTLTLTLRAGRGSWQPEGPGGPALLIEALGEAASALTVPGPLIRVAEGTSIAASIRNDLDTPFQVHGLCKRDGSPCPSIQVPPGQAREVRFKSGRPGTYHYWATSMNAPVPFRELAGAFIVDPAGGSAKPDRVFVITEWSNLTGRQLREVFSADDPSARFLQLRPRIAFMINGLAWPSTERLTYQLGETVRWRVINLSSQSHPMHLHGFYFDVNALGDGLRDQQVDAAHTRRVVTQLMPPGGTMAMSWMPERAGNWVFHCHIMHHVSPLRRLTKVGNRNTRHHQAERDGSGGMAGMVLGITVQGPGEPSAVEKHTPATETPRKLTMVMRPGIAAKGHARPAGFVLSEGTIPPASDHVGMPGPTLVLRRDEPVEITLVNRLSEATAIHWHGMELDSYYDGVHGLSGNGKHVAQMIEPSDRFVVRFTPPRAGTFMYHTHLHEYRQLSSGLYGPMIVTDPGESFDPATDHVLILGRSGVTSEVPTILSDPESVVLNGERSPRFIWRAGQRHRVRFINITPDDIFTVSLQTAEGPEKWMPLTKDGARLPPAEATLGPARQTLAVGETYDFEYQAPAARKTVWIEIRNRSGKWQAQGQVNVK